MGKSSLASALFLWHSMLPKRRGGGHKYALLKLFILENSGENIALLFEAAWHNICCVVRRSKTLISSSVNMRWGKLAGLLTIPESLSNITV